jgi:putative sterol carrier protein
MAEIMMKVPERFVAERAAGVDAVVHFKFTGTEAGEWNAVVRNGRCEVAQGIPRARPSVTVTADSRDFQGVLLGEQDAMAAFMSGTLKVQGELDLAVRLMKLFIPS